jgi:hypothetical protein
MTGHYRYAGEKRPEMRSKSNAAALKQPQLETAVKTVDAGAAVTSKKDDDATSVSVVSK